MFAKSLSVGFVSTCSSSMYVLVGEGSKDFRRLFVFLVDKKDWFSN